MTKRLTGPADTADAAEVVTTVNPNQLRATAAGLGAVRGIATVSYGAEPERTEWLPEDRTETYTAEAPNGELLLVEHNIELGSTRVLGPAA